MKHNRRDFIKKIGLGSMVMFLPLPQNNIVNISSIDNDDEFSNLSYNLLIRWCNELLKYQVRDKNLKNLYGGILCPSCNRVHGRCGDAIYPLMYLSSETKDIRYLNAAVNLFNWMENNISLPDGSWVNDINVSNWKGTTVFSAITLCEALFHHGHLLEDLTKKMWLNRLDKAAQYIRQQFHINFSNINYPVSAAYALTIIGDLLNNNDYKEYGKKLSQQCLSFFTQENYFLYGEGGKNRGKMSSKGCHPVDLGYNVEESLPALALYGMHTNDEKVLKVVTKSLQTHAEFMIPDGAWDNSWGTRNYKWTYWGSRTSDGCQPAYLLLADRDPVFYKVALYNTRLMNNCSQEGLLKAGLSVHNKKVPTCIHHTFTHAKAIATALDKSNIAIDNKRISNIKFPREKLYGVKKMEDIQTWLFSNESWVATVTGYDFEYTIKNGHPTGGALSLL